MQCIHSSSRVLAFSLLAVVAACADAAPQRTFVASGGVDNPTCSLASPCRTFGAAITAVNAGGEVVVLDSAGYGIVTIAKSVSIIAPSGIYAGVSAIGGADGVVVNGAGIDVRLKGLAINGQPGGKGIRFLQGTSLSVEACTVTNFAGDGISIEGAGNVGIVDSASLGNVGSGLNVNAPATVTIVRARFERNQNSGVNAVGGPDVSMLETTVAANAQFGIFASQSTAGTTRFAIESSLISDHLGATGVFAGASGASANLHLQIARSTVARNFQGIYSSATAGGISIVSATQNQSADNANTGIITGGDTGTLRASQNTVVGNGVGFWQSSGTNLYTQGNNLVRDNGVDDNGHSPDTPL